MTARWPAVRAGARARDGARPGVARRRCPSGPCTRGPTRRRARGLGGPLPDGPTDPALVVDELAARHRAGADGDAVGTVLRLGDRRHAPGRARGGLAHERVGPEHRDAVRDARARSPSRTPPAAWLLDLLGLPADRRRRVRDRRDDGELHRPGRRAPAGARRRGLGREPRRAGGRPARPRARRRGAARDPRPRAALPRARGADGRRRGRRRDGSSSTTSRGPWPTGRGPTIVCLQAGQPALRRVRPDGRGDRGRARARRLGARRRRVRALGGGVTAAARSGRPGSRAPTRGRPTRTRRSTCRTTAASRSSRAPSRCGARSACRPSTSRRSRARATRWRRCPSCRDEPAGCRCGRRCGRSGGPASRTWSTGSSCAPSRSPTASPRSTAPRSSTTSCSRRSASRSAPTSGPGAVGEALLADGGTWMSGSRWQGRDVLRVSVSNWSTDDEDVARSVDAPSRRAVAAAG